MFDVIIIGSGVSGSSVARELSRYSGKFAVLDKGAECCTGTSKANSGIVHGGYDAMPGSLMAKLNVIGNKMMEDLSKELDFPFKRTGSIVVCSRKEDIEKLHALKRRGEENGVSGLEVLNRDELLKTEPNLGDEIEAGLLCRSAGIVCPFNLNIALAENAYTNGIEFYFNIEVKDIVKRDYGYDLITNNGVFKTKAVVNAAGVYADKLHNMVSENKIHITPRRGTYLLLDKKAGGIINHTIFQLPTETGKGVLTTPTVDGNILLGPTATDISDKEDTETTKVEMDKIFNDTQNLIKNLPYNLVITSFSGLRAHEDGHEFIIGEANDAEGFFDAAGIESPGLTASPALGKMIADMIEEKYKFPVNENFNGKRKGISFTREMTFEEHSEKIKENPMYGNLICRCEKVTEAEIVDAIKRPLGARSVDGVKRRTRALAGRCQGGFCTARIIDIMARELNVDKREVLKDNITSNYVTGYTKGGNDNERV